MNAVTAAVLLASGLACRYDPHVMATVVDNRVRMGQLPPGTDPAYAVAIMDCEHLGKPVWLQLADGTISGPHVVADCSQAEHRDAQAARGWAVDLAYPLAVKLDAVDGPLYGVRVWDRAPREVVSRRR